MFVRLRSLLAQYTWLPLLQASQVTAEVYLWGVPSLHTGLFLPRMEAFGELS